MKIIYFIKKTVPLEYYEPSESHYLHIEGTNFTIKWHKNGKIYLLDLPVDIQKAKTIKTKPVLDLGPPIEKVNSIDLEDIAVLSLIEADEDHLLYKIIIILADLLKKQAELEQELKSQQTNLLELIKKLPLSFCAFKNPS